MEGIGWKLLYFSNANHSTENSGNSGRKIKCDENCRLDISENLCIPRNIVLFPGNSRKCCFIRYWKFPEIQTRIFLSNGNRPWYTTRKRYLTTNLYHAMENTTGGQNNQWDIRAPHDGMVRCKTFLHSDWLSFLWMLCRVALWTQMVKQRITSEE